MTLETKQLQESLKEIKKDKKEVTKYAPISSDVTHKDQSEQDKKDADKLVEWLQEGDRVDEYLKNSSDNKALLNVLGMKLRKPTEQERKQQVMSDNGVFITDMSWVAKFKTFIHEKRQDQIKNMYAIIVSGLKDQWTNLIYKKVNSYDSMWSSKYDISIERSTSVNKNVSSLTLSVPVKENLQTFEEWFLWKVTNDKSFATIIWMTYR